MNIIDQSGYDETPAEDLGLLPQDEGSDTDFLGDEVNDIGYSPLEYRPADLSWGFTEREEHSREPLAAKLARELPELEDNVDWDGIGDTTDTDGEILDDQVGDVRAGRLVWTDPLDADPASEFWAADLGIDGGAASAEEAAVHVVLESARPY